ncbi:hypothetical protein LOK49_LG02G01634 [Camellia lanceoleosa]|uniref:Uncharacterized protein n=1 Tax=Camellia lanceoleosa TaxID=1840588 RepID=A0ACC0IPU7_9ERIC|nr:hypothetical protein LOK49_LG02G01634 [Camellia lanceoleosa]
MNGSKFTAGFITPVDISNALFLFELYKEYQLQDYSSCFLKQTLKQCKLALRLVVLDRHLSVVILLLMLTKIPRH